MFILYRLLLITALALISACKEKDLNVDKPLPNLNKNKYFDKKVIESSSYAIIPLGADYHADFCLAKKTNEETYYLLPNCKIESAIGFDSGNNQRLLTYNSTSNRINFIFYLGDYHLPIELRRGVTLFSYDKDKDKLSIIKDKIQLQEFDSYFYSYNHNSKEYICSVNKCAIISQDNIDYFFITTDQSGSERITESKISQGKVFSILKNEKTNSYNLSEFDGKNITEYEIPINCFVPFGLKVTDGKAEYSCLDKNSRNSILSLLNNELKKINNVQIRNIAITNNDGRIIWEQKDYLPSLITITSEEYFQSFEQKETYLKTKDLVEAEIKYLEEKMSSIEFMASKRYSLSGESAYFLIHNHLFIDLISKLRLSDTDPSSRLIEKLIETELTIENFKEIFFNNTTINTVFIKKGSDFWADGVNAPYNFTSAIVIGLLSQAKAYNDYLFAEELLTPLLKNEFSIFKGSWHYWWGLGKTGWTSEDNVSLNTPSYLGNSSIANKSYLAIDAEAILALEKVSPNADVTLASDRVRQLIYECKLPFYLWPTQENVQECLRVNYTTSHASEFREAFSIIATLLQTQ